MMTTSEKINKCVNVKYVQSKLRQDFSNLDETFSNKTENWVA